MEALTDLLPLLFIGLYYLLAGRRRAKQKKAAQQRVVAPQEPLVDDEPRASTPFQSFLAQLEEAVEEAQQMQRPEPVAQPEPPPPPEIVPPAPIVGRPLPSLGSPEFHAVRGSFDATEPVDHDAHGFGDENPLSEEAFERAPAGAPRRRAPRKAYDPHGLRRTAPSPTGVDDWHHRLNDPTTAREAFVLQTIFGRRGGRRGDTR